MNALEFTSRLERVFRENSPEDICMYIQTRALTDPQLGYVLMDRFGRYPTDDARALVQQCFLNPLIDRDHLRTKLDWRQIDRNLGHIMQQAQHLYDQGNDLQAIEIARYVLLTTYQEYRDDHPSAAQLDSNCDYHTGEALQLLRTILIEGTRLPLKRRREILIAITSDLRGIQRKDWFCALPEFLEDARAVTMTRKGYIGFLQRKISASRTHANPIYILKLARFYLQHDDEAALRALWQQYPDLDELRQLMALHGISPGRDDPPPDVGCPAPHIIHLSETFPQHIHPQQHTLLHDASDIH